MGLQRGRVVLVSTTVHAQRTTTGAGPGARWLKVVHDYSGGRCAFNFVNYSWRLEYLVPHRGGTQTLFVFREIYDSDKAAVTGYEALEVSVRTPYERLPEFAPGWRDQCGDGWAQAQVP